MMYLKYLLFLLSLCKIAQNIPHYGSGLRTYLHLPIFLVLGYTPPIHPYYQILLYNPNYMKNKQGAPILQNQINEETGSTITQESQTSSDHPKPGQIVQRLQESATSTSNNSPNAKRKQTAISLEYQPMRPFFAGSEGFSIGQIVQPGQAWPASVEGYQNFSQTTTPNNIKNRVQETTPKTNSENSTQNVRPSISSSKPTLENRVQDTATVKNTTDQEETVSLEYKPNRPFFAGNTGFTIGQIVPPGKPWPASEEDYQTTTSSKPNLENRGQEIAPAQEETISLENKPNRPFFAGNAGSIIGQIVPPSEPWPASEEGYQTTSSSKPNLENKFQDTTTVKNTTSQLLDLLYSSLLYQTTTSSKPNLENRVQEATTEGSNIAQEQVISLGYKPMRPFHYPKPVTLSQIIPTGKPWPDSTAKSPVSSSKPNLENRVQDVVSVKNKTAQEETISLEYKPNRPFFAGNTGFSVGQIVPSGKPWPDSPEGYQNFSQTAKPNLENRVQETTSGTSNIAQEQVTSLEYKPVRPKPTTLGQVVPTVKPWPNSNPKSPVSSSKPNLENRMQDVAPVKNKTAQEETISLEYKPNRPFFAGNTGFSVGQIVPSGKPWPDSPEGYQNFSQTAKPNLENRVQETTSGMSNMAQEQVTSLEYKPVRPFYYPKPTTLGQVVPTGKPWPDSLDGYQNFTATVENRFQESTTNKAEDGFIWEDDVLAQPRPNSALYTSDSRVEGESATTEGPLYTSSILKVTAEPEARLDKDEALNVSALPLKMPFISIASSGDDY